MWTRSIVITVITTLLAGCVVYAYSKGRQSGMQAVQTLWNSEKLDIANAISEELMRVRQRESALRALAAKLREEKRDEANRLAREYAADLERLRHRPEARAADPAGLPEGAASGVGCTGAGLAQPDARFLVWFAAQSARLAAAYDECRVKYEAVTKEQ